MGFKQGPPCPNACRHKEKGFVCSAHRDDSTFVGPKSALDWLDSEIGPRYDIAVSQMMGPDDTELHALNRAIWCAANRIEYEVDPRQGKHLVLR